MIGTYRGTINRIARGTQVPSFETLQNLHLNTDLDIIWLLTGNPMGEWDLLRHGGQAKSGKRKYRTQKKLKPVEKAE